MTSRDIDVNGISLNDWYYYDGNGKAKYPKLGNCFFKYKEYENEAGYEDLKNGRDFTVSSYKYKDNKKPGVGTVTFTMNFKGNYSGSLTNTLNFYIAPKLAKMTKVKEKNKTSYTVKGLKRHKTYYIGGGTDVHEIKRKDCGEYLSEQTQEIPHQITQPHTQGVPENPGALFLICRFQPQV